MRMYDNIRLLCRYPFKDKTELQTFAARFGLFVMDKNKGILHNSGYDTLEQNRGVYINVTKPTEGRKGKILINVSLHKFWNATHKRGLQNWNDFNFDNAKEAARELSEFLGIKLHSALVKKFEVGLNLQTKEAPPLYMRELISINIIGKPTRILEDLHYKEFAQFSTSKEKNKRVVYIWYHKTHEATTKQKKAIKRDNIPKNILRLEKDVKRPDKRIFFSQLFKPEFTNGIKKDFENKFVNKTQFKTYPIKPANISYKQLEIFLEMQSKGFNNYIAKMREKAKRGLITRGQLNYIIKNAKQLQHEPPTVINENNSLTTELKQLIKNKLNIM